MARRRAAPGGARGGEVVQAPRPSRTRLITGAGAVAALGAVSAYAWAAGGEVAAAGGVLAAAGAAVVAAAIVLRLAVVVPWGIALAGAGYALAHARLGTVDGWAAAVGAALLLAAELAAWSGEDDRLIRAERQVVVRRIVTVGGLVATSALASFVLVGAAALSLSTGLALTAVGVGAAVAAVAIVLRVARV